MKIHLSYSTAGRYGGALKGNLKFLYRVIQQELDKNGFISSFDDLRITLAYPPMYVLPGVVGIEKDFKKYYDTSLPYYRSNRRYKNIEITLRAPEFSELFQKEEQKKYKHTFEIEKQYKDISEVDLGRIIVDKYLEAVEIISSKLKKDDIFDVALFKEILLSIKSKITTTFLESINQEQTIAENSERLQYALDQRGKRKQENKPKDKFIQDLRLYYTSELPLKALYPYDYQYSEIFRRKLQQNGLMCPGYDHLYINIGENKEELLKRSYGGRYRLVYLWNSINRL